MDKEHSTEHTSTYCDSIPEIWEWMTAAQKKKVVEMELESNREWSLNENKLKNPEIQEIQDSFGSCSDSNILSKRSIIH